MLFSACASSTSEVVKPSGLPSLQEIARQAAANPDDFLIRQNGADFATDLQFHGCSENGTNANFAPSWSNNPPSLANSSYCIYRLTFDPADAPITLALNWAAPPASNTDCWLAVSNWTEGRWEMQTLPVGNELTLATPADYVDANQHCYVAVIMLGDTACSLATIGFGTPAPPVNLGAGYTLVAPLGDTQTYLIDMDGSVAHEWTAGLTAGAAAELLENGHLLRAANLGNAAFNAGGRGGRLTEFDWDGNVVWYYDLSTNTQCSHHDFRRLPNGNVLLIAWNLIDDAAVIDAGRDPATLTAGKFWADSIVEIEPVLPSGGNVVWEWKVMDHVVQDYDVTKLNFADPQQHPELVDVNFPQAVVGDWTHFNGIYYNAELDQIIVTVREFSELWVIDHTTTMLEAAGHVGGTYGKGGDLLYRWGNPQSYRTGSEADRQLYFCHNSHWIPAGLDGAGDLLIFNNGGGPGRQYSTVTQITPPLNPDGTYALVPGEAYGPTTPNWEYRPAVPFFSPVVSSAQRLPGGGTLICAGASGHLFELDAADSVIWNYQIEPTQLVFRAIRYPYDYPGVAGLP